MGCDEEEEDDKERDMADEAGRRDEVEEGVDMQGWTMCCGEARKSAVCRPGSELCIDVGSRKESRENAPPQCR